MTELAVEKGGTCMDCFLAMGGGFHESPGGGKDAGSLTSTGNFG